MLQTFFLITSAILLPVVVCCDTFAQDQSDTKIKIFDLEQESIAKGFSAEIITVDREAEQYLGHPTTCLLEDGKTILCVYPKGHGRGAVVYKRSTDSGRTWSDRLPTPESWKSSKETPTLHRLVGPDGTKRIVMFSGLYPIRMATSEDNGETWSQLKKIGDYGGIVAMSSVFDLRTGAGHYMALFHDDGRFISAQSKREKPVRFTVYKVRSQDGGITWSSPTAVISSNKKHLCEPGIVRSPDGKQLACLLRENSRKHASQVIFSEDEGESWGNPIDLPEALQGDRHTAKYLPDGRLFISLRCRKPDHLAAHPFQGDWIAWLGEYDDLIRGSEGQMLIRLQDNMKAADCAYPGVEVLPDGTIVTTTYGHWEKDEPPFILAIRLKLD